MYASAHDLVRFGMAHGDDKRYSTPRMLRAESIREMQRVHAQIDVGSGYGLGWQIDDDGGFRQVGHTGGMPGVTTVLTLFPPSASSSWCLRTSAAISSSRSRTGWRLP